MTATEAGRWTTRNAAIEKACSETAVMAAIAGQGANASIEKACSETAAKAAIAEPGENAGTAETVTIAQGVARNRTGKMIVTEIVIATGTGNHAASD